MTLQDFTLKALKGFLEKTDYKRHTAVLNVAIDDSGKFSQEKALAEMTPEEELAFASYLTSI